MTPLEPAEIRGNWATLLLPIQENEAIDFTLLAEEIEHFIAARVNGVYSNGSSGEFQTQTEAEFDRVSQLLGDKCNRAGLPFQIGACHTSAQLSRERLRRTKALRPSAFQVILPDWFPLAWPEIITFLETMAADKAAAVAGGWLPGLAPRLRWPYRSAAADTIRSIADAARREVPELFELL